MIRLNIGAGDTELDGYTPIDRKLGSEAYPLPYEDNSVDEIRASHILEHFSFADAQQALNEWVRVLKPGGVCKVAVPDVDRIDKRNPHWHLHIMGGQTDSDNYHRSCYDRDLLYRYMDAAGLVDIEPWHDNIDDCSSLAVSLNLAGTKPDATEQPHIVKIAAITGVPRIGYTAHWSVLQQAFWPFNIHVWRHTGCFWHENIQALMEDAIAKGLDWVFCVDYDSMFTAEHVQKMIGYFANNPHMDALAPLQARRNSGRPLAGIGDHDGTVRNTEPIQVKSAHFGLTLIRLDRLRGIPKPWMQSVPGPDGTFARDNRTEADIYFWRQWEAHGRNLYLAHDVRIGHLEEMVTVIGDAWQPEHMYVGDWLQAHGIRD